MDFINKLMSLVTTTTMTLTGAVSGPDTSKPKVLSDLSEQSKAFTELMEDPIAYAHFQKVQGSLLATNGEYGLYSLFNRHPLLSKAFRYLSRTRSQGMNGYLIHSKLTSVQLSEWTKDYKGDRIYEVLFQTVVELAQSMGFKKAAIENLQLYVAPGEANAFTVSGSDDRIVVVVQAGMLHSLSISQIKAVIAHELMHIRRSHIIVEQMTKMMLTLMRSVLVEGLNPPSQPVESDAEAEKRIAAMAETYRRYAVKRVVNAPTGLRIEHGSVTQLSANEINDLEKQEEVRDDVNLLVDLEQKLLSDHEGLVHLLIAFSSQLAAVIDEVGSSPASVAYFKDIAVRLSKDPTFIYDRAVQFNPELYDNHANLLLGALSQSVETTADRGAASQVPSIKLAAGLARVMGLPFNLENELKILAQISAQGDEVLSATTPEHLSEFLAKAGDHPFIILRINNIITNMPAYPFNLFANRFSKLLLLHQSIVEEVLLLEAQLKHLPPEQMEKRPALEESRGRVQATLDRVWNVIEKALTANVVQQGDNPRARNLLEYVLVQRELILDAESTVAQLAEAIKGQNNKAFEMAIQMQAGRISLWKAVLAKLVSNATNLVEKQTTMTKEDRDSRLKLLSKAMGLTDIGAVRDLRLSLAPSVQNPEARRYRRMGPNVADLVNTPKIPVARGKPAAVTREKPLDKEEPESNNHQIVSYEDCARHFMPQTVPANP